MAGDWIKVRVGIRKNPKVIAMARYMSLDRQFMNAWSDPVRHTCRDAVTEIVTFENVTRVTVCALAEVWGALNGVLSESGVVPFMSLTDLDDISGLPSFGQAMESVGWVEVLEDGGLKFPNFSEHNTPEKERRTAKTQAERAKEYRERKKAAGTENSQSVARHDRHVTSHREEKRREEKSIKPTTSIVQSREVLVPEKMQTPEVQQRAAMWFAHLDVSHPEKRPLPDSPQMQAFWEVASRLGPERFCDAVLFSVSSGFANLREQSETKQGHTQQSGPRRNRNGKLIQEMPKEW